MDEHDWLVERFEAHRSHLRAVAYRMLGSLSEADDAVQEAWMRVSGADTSDVENLGGWLTIADLARQREVVDAFFAAARDGDFDALVALLDPDVVARSDGGPGATFVIRGAANVAGRARSFYRPDVLVRPALVSGTPGAVITADGQAVSIMAFTVRDGKIVELDALTDPERLAEIDLTVLDD